MVEDLRHSNKVVRKRLKPWSDNKLQLGHNAQSAIARLHWLLEQVAADTDGPTSLALVKIAQQDVAQIQDVLPPIIRHLATLHAQIEAALEQ